MSLLQHYVNTLRKRYATFNGRASRTEYNSFILFFLIFKLTGLFAFFIAIINTRREIEGANQGDNVDKQAQMPLIIVLLLLYNVFILLLHVPPFICLAVRRGHDLGLNGWVVAFLWLVIGRILLVLLPGDSEANQYGPPPGAKR